MPLVEIRAPERAVPRYCPARPLPPYRFVPGLQPHPTRHPAGHSYAAAGSGSAVPHPAWKAAEWRQLDAWLAGVDRFNAFYFWEAHESWESLWAVATPRDGAPARTLQGLIQSAAALLKIHLGTLAGAASLSRTGIEKLAESAAVSPTLLGLDLRATTSDFRHYFRPLAERTLPPLDASVPVLRLAARDHG
jgi:hypothetical protein